MFIPFLSYATSLTSLTSLNQRWPGQGAGSSRLVHPETAPISFANFYHLPHTRLTSSKIPFQWSELAQAAFTQGIFTFTVLIQPDTTQQFIVEVDAWDSWMGDALLQQKEGKLYPCWVFSHCFSPAEHSCDVCDQQLFIVKRNWPWKSGYTGWGALSILSFFGQIIKTSPTSKQPNTSMSGKLGGLCSLPFFNLVITYRSWSLNIRPDLSVFILWFCFSYIGDWVPGAFWPHWKWACLL